MKQASPLGRSGSSTLRPTRYRRFSHRRGWDPDNNGGTNSTPNFPSYTSGHATFGSAMFQVLRRYYGTDDIAFSFQSDEFNGVTRDDTGAVRPPRTRAYGALTQAEIEN